MERDSLGIRLRDLPLMTLAISTRTPQQALAALLESTGQAGEFERYMAQADIQITPSTP